MCYFRVFLDGTRRVSAPHAPLTSRNSTGGRVPGPYRRVPRTHPRTWACSPCSRVPHVPREHGEHVPREPPSPRSMEGTAAPPHSLPRPLGGHGTHEPSRALRIPASAPARSACPRVFPRGHAGKEQVGTGLNDASLGAPCASRAPERGSSPARPKVPPNMRTSAPFLSPNAPRPHPRRERNTARNTLRNATSLNASTSGCLSEAAGSAPASTA